MKACRECGAEKPLTDYYRHPHTKDGYRPKCKACYRVEHDKYRRENPGVYQGIRDRRKGTLKYRANVTLNLAVKCGRVVRPSKCESCDTGGRIEGHHDDYAKPLDVRWLCTPCHNRWHTENGEGKNGDRQDEGAHHLRALTVGADSLADG